MKVGIRQKVLNDEKIKKVKKPKALKDNDELWICGQWQKDYKMWEFQGVFLNRDKAIDACKNIRYFIFPTLLNKELPIETVILDVCEYPYQKGKS